MIRSLIIPSLFLLAACGQQSGEPDIQLGNAWARPTAGQAPGAVYVSIANDGPSEDRLVGAFTDHAAMAMVHQNEIVNGVARMRMAGEIRIPAGDQIDMVPGGTHVMLEGLRAPLKAGDEFELVLKFKEAGDKKVTVRVVKADAL
ncbi:MAG TPA: copper chaperone PCu(A)C [Sphingomicrobium sp.]|nr:copper chaperone PCu(A)C [Sphingomicrobium sp.]